jgi:hypothetical protein
MDQIDALKMESTKTIKINYGNLNYSVTISSWQQDIAKGRHSFHWARHGSLKCTSEQAATNTALAVIYRVMSLCELERLL